MSSPPRFVLLALALGALLAGCAGGSGALATIAGAHSTSSDPAAVVPFTATPSPTPNPDPLTVGDTFSYSGSITDAQTFAYPSPSPLPATTRSATVSAKTTIEATPYPYASVSSVDLHTAESDTYSLSTQTYTVDAWKGSVAVTGGSHVLLYGYKTVDGAGDTFLYRFTGGQIVDELPEKAQSWTNAPTVALNEADADGTTAVRTIGSAGQYNETQTYPDTLSSETATIAVASTGSGTYSGSALQVDGIEKVAFSAPSAGTIAITATYENSETETAEVKAWFAAPLAKETDVMQTAQAFPASCAVPSTFGTSGNLLTRTVTTVDPVLGTSDVVKTLTYIAPSFGSVCVAGIDTDTFYYDYDDDNGPYLVVYSGGLERTHTVQEIETLRTETLKSAVTASSLPAAAAFAPVDASAVVAHLAALREHDRSGVARTLLQHFHRLAASRRSAAR